MATSAERPTAPSRLRPLSRTRWWWGVRLVLLAGGAVLALLLGLVGVHPTSVDVLRDDLAAGRTTAVEVRGEPVLSGEGFSTQEVRWRSGLAHRSTTVVAVTPGTSPADLPQTPDEPGGPVVVDRDVVPGLRDLAPALEVQRTAPVSGTTWQVLDADVPGWLAALHAGWWVAVAAVLLGSPRTWRLNRWGWGWLLVLVPPVGAVLLLALSGPTPGIRRPRGPRLGGGTGLLVGIVLGAVLPPWLS